MISLKLKATLSEMKVLIPAVYLALKDKRTPFIAKVFAELTIGYALSPIDLIPDFIPILGYLDDLIIIPVLIKLTFAFIPNDSLEMYKEEAKTLWKDGRPKKWYYAIPIIIVWFIIIYWLYKLAIYLF